MSPKVLIPVFFNAPLGGLQENVRAQAIGLRTRGFEPMVVCRPGPFAESLETDGVRVFTSDFESPESEARSIMDQFPPDIVHFHPFKSRVLGLQVAEKAGCPAISTIHGLYRDGIEGWIDRVAQVVTVSSGVREYVVGSSPELRSKTIVIPNGVDTKRFRPRESIEPHAGLSILVAGRFDVDTSLLVELLIDTWASQVQDQEFRVRWEIAGHGARIEELAAAAGRLNMAAGTELVRMHGWLGQESLAALHARIDLTASAGRNALESMASGIPTITLGQKAYYGPTWSGGTDGMAWNWGHVHDGGAESGALYRDITEALLLTSVQRERIAAASRQFVEVFHNQVHVDDSLAALYAIHLATASG